MKNKLNSLSISAFALSLPALIIVNWYLPNYGIFVMFLFLTIGLVLDQVKRLLYPNEHIESIVFYRKNRILKTLTLVFFLQSPMAILYGNRIADNFGTGLGIVLIGIGIISDQIARNHFNYKNYNC